MRAITLTCSGVVMGMQEGENTKDNSSEEEREARYLMTMRRIIKDR
jgi:hypothetical protein